jgi:DNA-binding SARP family transcriptional activator
MVVTAPAGYGKSQLMARWCEELGRSRSLGYALCSRLGETPSTILELLYASLDCSDRFRADVPWQEQADTLLELLFEAGPTTLIVDDVHHLESDNSQAQECGLLLSYLLDYRAPECHWIFSGRSKPQLADLELKVMAGQVEMLSAASLSLGTDQLERLSPGNGERLYQLTSGWPMACAVLLKTDPERWEEQRDKLGHSLLKLATEGLRPEESDAVAVLGLVGTAARPELEHHGLWQILEPLSDRGALIQHVGEDKLAVHPLFAERYREEANQSLRSRAVELLSSGERAWEALELVPSGEPLTELLLKHGEELLGSGRLRLLERLLGNAAWHPRLAVLQGRMHWAQGDPAQALECFQEGATQAGAGGDTLTAYRSWRAAGQLYIDAVCPADAQSYLKKAYRALGPGDKKEKASTLQLLAENAVNVGQAKTAQRYRALARRWDQQNQEDLALTARLLLRSGRLTEARGAVQVAIKQAEAQEGPLEGHRDPRLVLSYLGALDGLVDEAKRKALEVLDEAREQSDRRTESVALLRLAHAHLIEEKGDAGKEPKALQLYSEADSLAKTLGVERLRAEPLMGLSLYYIYQGNVPRAYEACHEGLELAKKSGDEWLTAWLGFVRAIAAIEGGHPSSGDLLRSARQEFRACRDRFGYALTEVWEAVHSTGNDVGRAVSKHLVEFPFLSQRESLFAPPAEQVAKLKATDGDKTSPSRLQVFCLGPLSLLRDGEPVPPKAFKRKKARELFVLLLASPDTFFHREELAAQLWPKASQKAALRDFRVALHALSDALEPERAKNTTAFCIDRQEERYRLLSGKLDLDSTRFEALTSKVEPDLETLEKAVRLYRGPFCEDYPYLEELEAIRRRYSQLYLQAAEALAEHYLSQDQAAAATELAQKMLQRDATWEPAYRVLMRSQHALGHEHLLPRTFTRCLETLEEELGVEPSEDTFALARELLGDQLATLL